MTSFQEKVYPVRKFRKDSSREKRSKFSNGVLNTVKKIPRGKVLSYKEVAKLVGNLRAWRAVGNILSKNRDPKIPCHRVIRSDGKVGGYRGGPRYNFAPENTREARVANSHILFRGRSASPNKGYAYSAYALRKEIRRQNCTRGGQKRKIELLKKEGIK